jgi:hypothetical protein
VGPLQRLHCATRSSRPECADQDERISRYLLSQRLPDSTAVFLEAITSVKARWDKVKSEFSVKSQYAETDLLTAFTDSEMRCPRGGKVRSFLGQMRVKREELAAVGVTMPEKENTGQQSSRHSWRRCRSSLLDYSTHGGARPPTFHFHQSRHSYL